MKFLLIFFTFSADLNIKRIPSLADIRLFNWRVPALVYINKHPNSWRPSDQQLFINATIQLPPSLFSRRFYHRLIEMTVFSDCRFSNCRFYVQLIAPFSDIARPSSAFPLSRAIASVMDLGPSWIGQKIRNEIRLCKHSMSLKLHWKQRWKRQLHDIISGSYRRLKPLFITVSSYSSPQGINILS